jgi:hypothetical protein
MSLKCQVIIEWRAPKKGVAEPAHLDPSILRSGLQTKGQRDQAYGCLYGRYSPPSLLCCGAFVRFRPRLLTTRKLLAVSVFRNLDGRQVKPELVLMHCTSDFLSVLPFVYV